MEVSDSGHYQVLITAAQAPREKHAFHPQTPELGTK